METLTRLGEEIDKIESETKNDLKEARQDLERRGKEIEDELRAFKENVIGDLATLKEKSALLGSLAGAILGGLMALLVEGLKK